MRELIPGANQFARRQDVPPVYRINATLYLWRRKLVVGSDDWRSGRLRMHVVPESRAVHIDEPEQFDQVQFLLERGHLRFPWMAGEP